MKTSCRSSALLRKGGDYDRALSDEDGSTFVERDDVDWLDDFELTKDDLADGK